MIATLRRGRDKVEGGGSLEKLSCFQIRALAFVCLTRVALIATLQMFQWADEHQRVKRGLTNDVFPTLKAWP